MSTWANERVSPRVKAAWWLNLTTAEKRSSIERSGLLFFVNHFAGEAFPNCTCILFMVYQLKRSDSKTFRGRQKPCQRIKWYNRYSWWIKGVLSICCDAKMRVFWCMAWRSGLTYDAFLEKEIVPPLYLNPDKGFVNLMLNGIMMWNWGNHKWLYMESFMLGLK